MKDRKLDPVSPARPKRRFLAGLLTGGLAGALLAGSASLVAYAHDGPGGGARCMGRHAAMGPEAMRNRVEFATDWMLKKVDATDQQKVKVKEIVGGAVAELAGLRETHMANREALMATLTAETVDRARLETLRQSEVELAGRASQRITLALADVADVLTPEQRRGLADLARSFGGPMGFGPGRHRGPGAPGEHDGPGERPPRT
ncbi:MAG: Spy/CpxP family protein refolding chaperone [Betaproteobacteria bacterium]